MTTQVFTSSGTFVLTGSSVVCQAQIWGAGGNGTTIRGGSGGAYTSGSFTYVTGGTNGFSCSVAQPYTGTGSDLLALPSSILTGSTVVLSAIGGSNTGDIAHQLTSGAVSGAFSYNQGGVGTLDNIGTENYNGIGGGSSGGPNGAGLGGSSTSGLSVTGHGTVAGAPGGAGYGAGSGSGAGGAGGYYDSGASLNRVIPPQNGAQPGGGGGGTYAVDAVAATSVGGAGLIIISY